jgi:hypothetical protein
MTATTIPVALENEEKSEQKQEHEEREKGAKRTE